MQPNLNGSLLPFPWLVHQSASPFTNGTESSVLIKTRKLLKRQKVLWIYLLIWKNISNSINRDGSFMYTLSLPWRSAYVDASALQCHKDTATLFKHLPTQLLFWLGVNKVSPQLKVWASTSRNSYVIINWMLIMYTIWDVEHAVERIADYLWKPILFYYLLLCA